MIKNMTTVRRLGSRVWGRGRRSVRADVEGMVRFEEVRRRRTLNPKPPGSGRASSGDVREPYQARHRFLRRHDDRRSLVQYRGRNNQE